MAYMSASYVLAAAPAALAIGGMRTSIWGQQSCCKHTGVAYMVQPNKTASRPNMQLLLGLDASALQRWYSDCKAFLSGHVLL